MNKETIDYKPDRDFWDVAKGLGIFLIIIGHCCIGWTSNFVYMFHLQLFFFISGYLYNEKKYGDNPWLNIQNKIKSLWFPYFLIIAFFVIFHNLFLTIGLQINGTESYTLRDTIVKVCEGMFGRSEELLAGPVWFLRTLAMAMILLGFIVFISRAIERRSNLVVKLVFQGICIALLTLIGYPFVIDHIILPADMHIAFVVMPFVWIGYLLRNYKGDIERLLNPIVAVIAIAIVAVVSCFETVDYAMAEEFPYMHVISLCGIYACLYLVKLIKKSGAITKFMAFVGQLSLYIMFIHFFILRVIDRIICYISGDVAGVKYEKIPVAFTNLWWLYLIICVPLSILIAFGLKKLIGIIQSFFKVPEEVKKNG